MRRKLTRKTSLENLKREAKRWLKALRAADADALARFRRANPDPIENPGLRELQHALAHEYGLAGWTALVAALDASAPESVDASRDSALVALLDAAGRGDAIRVAELLDAHPDIVSEPGLLVGNTGLRTALHYAASASREDVVRLLLERGADPNVRDEDDDAMPLHFAAEHEHLPIIRLLIEHGADPVGEGTDHELNVLGWATCFGKGRRDVVDYLVAHGARHSVFSAVATGDVEALRAAATESPSAIDQRMDRANVRRTPLHLAVVKKQHEALATLVELGADLEMTDAAGLTPLDQAALANEQDMAQLLIDRGARVNLPAAIALHRAGDIERLLREEPNALEPGGRWSRLIIRAAERSRGNVIDKLVRAGASVDVLDDTHTSVDSTTGYTALHAAAFAGNAAAVAALMKHGASVRARDGRYCGTPAGWAHHAGHSQVRDFIVSGSIDPFEAIAFDLPHRIPDIVARDPGSIDRRFGEYADCKPKPNQWWPDASFTPLMRAAEMGKVDMVRALLAQGADVNLHDSAGRGLLEIASDDSRHEVARLVAQLPAGERQGRA